MFFELKTVVQEDYDELVQEYDEASDPHVVYQPQRRRTAKELGIPYNRDEWTTADKGLYVRYGRWIPGWGSPSKALAQICEEQRERVDTVDDAKQQNERGRTSLAPTEDGHHSRTELETEQLANSDYALPSADHLELKEAEKVITSPHTESDSNPPVIKSSLPHKTQWLRFPPDVSQPYLRIFSLLLLSVIFHGLLKRALTRSPLQRPRPEICRIEVVRSKCSLLVRHQIWPTQLSLIYFAWPYISIFSGSGYFGHERERQREALEHGVPAFQKSGGRKIGSDYSKMVKM